MAKPLHIVIIGNGIAGITAARFIRKGSQHHITVISGESPYFFSRTALMYAFMGHMEERHLKPYEDGFWKKNKIALLQDWVEKIDAEKKEIVCRENGTISYDRLVLATGSQPRIPDLPEWKAGGIQGLYHLEDLHKLQEQAKNIKSAVILGGGLIGIELAEMLHSRGIHVEMIIRESHYWGNVLPSAEGELIGSHILEQKILLHTQSGIASITQEKGHITGITTTNGQVIPCEFLGVCIGVEPSIAWLKGSGLETDRGILINPFFETNLPDVYAIGDCAQHREPLPGRMAVEQVWYTGRIMGERLGKNLCGKPLPYSPGLWFNSAKFFDIEYQVYGEVPSDAGTANSFYWEERKERRCLRLYFDPSNFTLKGVHSFGIRLRQEVCEWWIQEGKHLDQVLITLEKANFDGEFSSEWASKVREKAREELPWLTIPEPSRKSWLKRWFSREQ
jgi:NAD(P)H-nitrite reductase large subunit